MDPQNIDQAVNYVCSVWALPLTRPCLLYLRPTGTTSRVSGSSSDSEKGLVYLSPVNAGANDKTVLANEQ